MNKEELHKANQLLYDSGIITDFMFRRSRHNINNEGKPLKFEPPTQQEVGEYFKELFSGHAIALSQAERFMDYYNTNNWMCGNKKMKNWKFAGRNWHRNWKERNGTSTENSTHNQSVASAQKGATPGVPGGASSGGANMGSILQSRPKQV